jgi:hypothetical protein
MLYLIAHCFIVRNADEGPEGCDKNEGCGVARAHEEGADG